MDEYIDYTEESTDDKPNKWTQKAFKGYFKDTFLKTHKVGGAIPWTMKEQVMLSRMSGEFNSNDLADMILYWHTNTSQPDVACQFRNFYSHRVDTYHKMKKATGDYSWN